MYNFLDQLLLPWINFMTGTCENILFFIFAKNVSRGTFRLLSLLLFRTSKQNLYKCDICWVENMTLGRINIVHFCLFVGLFVCLFVVFFPEKMHFQLTGFSSFYGCAITSDIPDIDLSIDYMNKIVHDLSLIPGQLSGYKIM